VARWLSRGRTAHQVQSPCRCCELGHRREADGGVGISHGPQKVCHGRRVTHSKQCNCAGRFRVDHGFAVKPLVPGCEHVATAA